MEKDTPRRILLVVLNNFGPSLFFACSLQLIVINRKRNALGIALASLDTFDKFYEDLSSSGRKEQVGENSNWDCN